MILFTDTGQVLGNFFSTDSCLSYLNNKLATGFESGLYTGVILIDLLKAFDTVNHDILLKKMEFIGFSEETTKWFKSFILRILSQNLEISYAEFLKDPF